MLKRSIFSWTDGSISVLSITDERGIDLGVFWRNANVR